MRLNKYTLKIENGTKTILYNLITKMLIEIDYSTEEFNKRFFADLESDQSFKVELKNKMIISEDDNDDFKELMLIKDYYNNSSSIGRFMIHLGYSCNLCCSYCYQSSINKIDKSKQLNSEDVIKFLTKVINEEEYEELDICFIGGEPLLYCQQILDISNAINIKFSSEKIIKYSLVTNGTLLSSEKIELLLKNKIDSFQITIDGNEKIHDSLRKDINGKGSFKKIINNILYIQDHFKSANISINCNINSKNYDDISKFLQYLHSKNIRYPVFFSLVFDNKINAK